MSKRGVLWHKCVCWIAILSSLCLAVPNVHLASIGEIEAFFGTSEIKFLFAQSSEGIYVVDYTAGQPLYARLVGANGDAMLPAISPDGKWLTYASGVSAEYSNKAGTIWLQSADDGVPIRLPQPGYVPRFVPASELPSIVFATCSRNDEILGGYTFQRCGAMIQAVYSGGSFSFDTVYTGGSFLGGLSADGRWFAHGEAKMHAFLFDIQQNQLLPLHCIEGRTLQVCNTSISPSTLATDAVLYFDFGMHIGPQELGGGWPLHSSLFISRSDGNIYKQYTLPQIAADSSVTSVEWNYPEWSTHPYYAIASILVRRRWNIDGESRSRIRNERIYAINLKDSTYLELARSLDTLPEQDLSMRWPALWVSQQGLNEDAGWLSTPLYENNGGCPELDTASVVPEEQSGSSGKDGGLCGRGAGVALLPPFVLMLWGRRRKK